MSADCLCKLCGKTARFRCTGCLLAHYCSKEHQKQDWRDHKVGCLPYKVETSEGMGRYLVATRNIEEGAIILEEKPLVEGPAQVTPPVCLGCHDALEESNKIDCFRCGWPMCSKLCAESESHAPECEITARRPNGKVKITIFVEGFSHPSYQCLTVLRCLSFKETKPAIWKKLMNLESHCEQRKLTPKNVTDSIFIAKFITEFFNFTRFSHEEILKVAGIVQINAHEVPLTKPVHVAIYEKASLLEHSCRPNCSKTFTNSGRLVIRAAAKIHPEEHLSICYTDPLWGRTTRFKHLLETKFFACKCTRCRDPTEFGTHFNSVKCRNPDCDGYCVPLLNEPIAEDVFSEKPPTFTWTCGKCKTCSSEDDLFRDVNKAMCNLERGSITSCLDFLKKFRNILHENHQLMINVKLAAIDLLGWPKKLRTLDDETLGWAIKTSREVYDTIKTVVPGENRLLGVLVYQMHFMLAEKAQRVKVDATEARENLMKCQQLLRDAYRYLQHEPDKLPEGMMAKEAKRALESINRCLK